MHCIYIYIYTHNNHIYTYKRIYTWCLITLWGSAGSQTFNEIHTIIRVEAKIILKPLKSAVHYSAPAANFDWQMSRGIFRYDFEEV